MGDRSIQDWHSSHSVGFAHKRRKKVLTGKVKARLAAILNEVA
jgi:hypothetical protein